MHAGFFALKRAYHSILRIGRDPLAKMGLTAARFDLLFALKTAPKHRMPQRRLQATLGVCRATVSRMLGSLEDLGLVKRTVIESDRRRKRVELTKKGLRRIGFAYRQLSRSGWAQLALDTALGDWWDQDACRERASQLLDTLGDIRDGFGDVADLEYPWMDFDPWHPAAILEDWLIEHDA